MRHGLHLRRGAVAHELFLPPLRPAAAFWARFPPLPLPLLRRLWLLPPPLPERLPPLLDASGVLAIAAARPQERMQLRRMADASLALAERRAGDLKDAVEKLGQEAPGRRQLLALQFMGLVAPPAGAGILLRIRGILILIVVVLGLLALGLGLVELISLPFGGVSLGGGILLGFLVVAAALGVMALLGRRRQQKARAERAAAGS